MLELKSISKSFTVLNDVMPVFKDFSLTVGDGEFVSVVGSNGSGKTTLLNLVSGTLKPDGGKMILDGKDVTNQKEYVRARFIGRVFQDPARGTSPNMTIAENMAIADNKHGSYNLGMGIKRDRLDYYRDLLRPMNLGLEDRMNVLVGSLSGGQRQVLTLITATMSPLKILLLDEHTAALDPNTSEKIMLLTDKIVKEKNITTLMVTHNLRHAVEYGSRLIMLDKGRAVMDISGEEKKNIGVNDVLDTFNSISVECGN